MNPGGVGGVGRGFFDRAGDVAMIDAVGAAGGAAAGAAPVITSPATAPAGAVSVVTATSAGQAACEIAGALGMDCPAD